MALNCQASRKRSLPGWRTKLSTRGKSTGWGVTGKIGHNGSQVYQVGRSGLQVQGRDQIYLSSKPWSLAKISTRSPAHLAGKSGLLVHIGAWVYPPIKFNWKPNQPPPPNKHKYWICSNLGLGRSVYKPFSSDPKTSFSFSPIPGFSGQCGQ